MVDIHLKDVNTLLSCNVIQVEGWLPYTWITLHICNFFNVLSLAEQKLHEFEVKHIKYVNILNFLPLAENLTGV